jgi:ABC-type nitrate/sulfonate/bicarbonate transport system substrate-binding protein
MSWSRRRFLEATTAGVTLAGLPRFAWAQGKPITVAHSVSTFVYGQHLVAREKKFFEEEGVTLGNFIVPGGGARVVNAVTAGQARFGLGDSNHPLKATEFGKAIYDVLDEKAWNRVFGGPIAVTVGDALKETLEKSPDLVQAYVNACYRAQQWIRKAKDEEIVELLYKPYMDTFERDIVRRSVAYYKTIFDWDLSIAEKDYQNALKVFVPVAIEAPLPYAKAVELSFLKKAQAKYKS